MDDADLLLLSPSPPPSPNSPPPPHPLQIHVTCCDYRHPPESTLDDSDTTFWSTTGSFPQEVVVDFGSVRHVKELDVMCSNVRKISIDTSEAETMVKFEPVIKQLELPNLTQQKQVQRGIKVNKKARLVRFTIMDGWQPFAAVYRFGASFQ